jgi:hypothetical protein
MAASAILTYDLVVYGDNGIAQRQRRTVRIPIGAGTSGKRETVTIAASTFTALSPPTGSKLLVLILGNATGLTWKGVTGDTGTTGVPTSNPLGIDAIIPLGATPSFGITSSNASDQTVEALWI